MKYSPFPFIQYKAFTPKNPNPAVAILPASEKTPIAFPLTKVA